MPPDDWEQWSQHVLKELERLNDCYEKLDNRLLKISNEVAALKVKSGIWGAIGGIIPILIIFVIWLIFKKM